MIQWGLKFTNVPTVAPTFGITRVDNGAVIVASGTAMTADVTNLIYSYSQTGEVAGVNYRFTYTVTKSNGQQLTTFFDKTASGNSAGLYAAQSDLENRWGVENVKQWSNLTPGATDTDTARVQLALDYADAEIHSFFNGGGYTVPFAGYSAGSTTAVKLREWAVVIAGKWLYSSRGTEDNNTTGDKLSEELEKTTEEMALYRGGVRSFSATGSALQKQFVPVAAHEIIS